MRWRLTEEHVAGGNAELVCLAGEGEIDALGPDRPAGPEQLECIEDDDVGGRGDR
jgi:hypothetical protein